MTCNDVRSALASLDHDHQLPGHIQSHLNRCPHCSRIARAMTAAENSALPPASAVPGDSSMVDAIMERITSVTPVYPLSRVFPLSPPAVGAESATSLATWISGGLLLSGALVAVRFSSPFQFLVQSSLGHTVDLWVTLSLSAILAGYLCVFAGSSALRPGPSAGEETCTPEAE